MNSRKDTMMLKFMEKTIENINTCLAGQYTLYRLFIEKGLITEDELISRIKEDKNLPQRKLGIEALKDMLTPDWEKQLDFSTTEQDFLNRACLKINALVLPSHWGEEGIEPPNSTAKRNAVRICHELFNSYELISTTVACTKENGVYLSFKNNNKSLFVEAYNSGEVATLVNDDTDKRILYSEDIQNLDFDATIKIFLNNQV